MSSTDLNAIYLTVEALIVIHNILVDLDDNPIEIFNLYTVDNLPVHKQLDDITV